jgi:hypothetical protein
MTINDSRLKNGTLKLGPAGTGQIDTSCQITNARITTAYSDDGDSLTVLCGDTVPAPRKLDGHKLEGSLVQDFDLDETSGGVIDYLWNHNLEVVDFEFVPNDATDTPVITGLVQLEIPTDTYGGDVNTRITTDFVWSMQGAPFRAYPSSHSNPKISALVPDTTVAGPALVTVTVNGTGFEAGATIEIDNDQGIPATLVSDTQLTFEQAWPDPGGYTVTVRNGDSGESNDMTFTVTALAGTQGDSSE